MSNSGWSTTKRKQLQQYIIPQNKTGKTFPVAVLSDTEDKQLDIYTVPIQILSYNFNNVRIRAEKYNLEKKLGEELDPAKESHQKAIAGLLRTSKFYSKEATEDLKSDLKKRGQKEPAIVSIDGVIWNANRRVAVREELYNETHDEKWNHVEVVVLPELTTKLLQKLEKRLQQHKSLKEKYGPIPERLDMRDLLNSPDWVKDSKNPTQVEKDEILSAYGDQFAWKEIEQRIEEINLIDQYLESINKKGDYEYLQNKAKGRGVEIFTALSDALKIEKENSNDNRAHLEKIKYMGYQIMNHPEAIYDNLRDFRDALKDPIVRNEILTNSKTYNDFPKITKSGIIYSPELVNKEFRNVLEVGDSIRAKKGDPKDVLQKVLKLLTSINETKIPKNNMEFNNTIKDIVKQMNWIKNKSDNS